MHSASYVIPETPDCLLEESPLSAELRARAQRAAAAAARSAHLAVLHPTHTTLYGKRDGRKKTGPELPVAARKPLPVKGSATLTAADPALRVTQHPIQLAHSGMLPQAGYISLQRHGEGCRSDDLVAINAYAWADLEIHEGHEFFGIDPDVVVGIVLARHDAAGVPRPSYATFSGRGLWLVYLADGFIPPEAKGRVLKACRAYWGEEITTGRGAGSERVTTKAAAMRALWQGGEIDWSVADMSRVHRIAGSTNDKSGETVRLVWPSSWADVRRSSFDDFCRAVLPFSREETQAYLSERAAAREARQASVAAERRPLNGFTRAPRPGRWAVVATEIMALIQHHAGDGAVPARLGLRDLLAHHLCCAWALSGRGGDARSWAAELAPYLCGHKLSERALATYLKPVEKGLRRHEAGETVWYTPPGGEAREKSPLYEYGVAKIVTALKITRELANALGFRILTPDIEDRKALTAAERQAARRERLGAKKRAAMDKAAQERAERIIELTAEGLEANEIAARLGCCTKTVERAFEAMFAGAADNVVIEGIEDEDVSDAELQALVVSCTRTDASRYLSEGSALQGDLAPAQTRPEPAAATETPAKPGKASRKAKTGQAAFQPQTPAWLTHGPLSRLLALYEHARSCRASNRDSASFGPMGCEWEDIEYAQYMLNEEIGEGRKLFPGGLKPLNRPKVLARLAGVGIDPYLYLPCPSPEGRLH
ncbi:Homeodomain-like domain-containing protein [Methylorubrum populi]